MEAPLALSFCLPVVFCSHSADKGRGRPSHESHFGAFIALLRPTQNQGLPDGLPPLHPSKYMLDFRAGRSSRGRVHLSKGFLAYLLFSFVFKTTATATPSYLEMLLQKCFSPRARRTDGQDLDEASPPFSNLSVDTGSDTDMLLLLLVRYPPGTPAGMVLLASVRRPFGASLVVPKLLAHPFFFVHTHNQPYSTWDIGFPSV